MQQRIGIARRQRLIIFTQAGEPAVSIAAAAPLQHHHLFRLADPERLARIDHAEIGRVPVAVAGFDQVAVNVADRRQRLTFRRGRGKARLMLQGFAQQRRVLFFRLRQLIEVDALRPEGAHSLPRQQRNQQGKGQQADGDRACGQPAPAVVLSHRLHAWPSCCPYRWRRRWRISSASVLMIRVKISSISALRKSIR